MGDSKAKARRRREFPPVPAPLPYPIVDNHTHIESIGEVIPDAPSPEQHLELAAQAGVTGIVQCGCDLPSARWTSEWLRNVQSRGLDKAAAQPLDRREPVVVSINPFRGHSTDGVDRARVLGAIAIHPNEVVRHSGIFEVAADGLAPHDLPHHRTPLKDAIAEIADLAANNPRIRAIGETGMDLFRAGPKGAEAQKAAFRDHIALAKSLDLALQIHDREAHQPVIETLLADGAPERTVFHCFSGDAEMAQVCADQGWYLSFAGPITYRANEDLRAAVRWAPLELILAETDAPYLTPHPYRGQPNAPYSVNYTVRALAEIKGIDLAQMCTAIRKNSEQVYGQF